MLRSTFRSSVQTFKVLQIPIIIFSLFHFTHSANILVYVGASTHSHRVAIQPLATALAAKGHNVTVVAPFKPEVPNPKITEFCPKGLQEYNDQVTKDLGGDPVVDRMKNRYYDPFLVNHGGFLWDMFLYGNQVTVKSPDFQEWVDKTKFDLIISEHPSKEIVLGIAHKHGAKVIASSPSHMWGNELDTHGIPTESSWYPSWIAGAGCSISSIPDRFYYEFNTLIWHLKYKWSYLPKMDALLKETYGADIPSIDDLIKNISLYFINTHFSTEYAKSFPPFVVSVGGMHVQDSKDKKPLPKNIEDFVSAKDSDGFVYISFGSMAKISALPKETRKTIFDAVASFKNAKFLIKWNDEIPEDMPKNVLPLPWFPQQDLLSHPKCRGFVSQGGLMSYQQATYHGVPVVIMPVFGDQPYNARLVDHHGNGIYLELADLNLDTFSNALSQLLYNKELSTKAKEVARRFKDRPMTPIETAVWWTEYVLRHNDTSHLKPLGINQEWWQRRQLDFWGLIFVVILLFDVAVFLAIRSLVRLFRKSHNTPKDKVKSQ